MNASRGSPLRLRWGEVCRCPAGAVASLRSNFASSRSARLELEHATVDRSAFRELLRALARERTVHDFDVSLVADVPADLDRLDAALLAAAGSRSLRIPPLPAGSPPSAELALVASVRFVSELGVPVSWHLPPYLQSIVGLGGGGRGLLYHLPPPESLAMDHPSFEGVLANWQEAHVGGLLTCVRGPGWLRIYDRRPNPRGHSFREVTLSGLQVEVFLGCASPVSRSELLRTYAGRASAAALGGFVSRLSSEGILLCEPQGTLVSLPLHLREAPQQ